MGHSISAGVRCDAIEKIRRVRRAAQRAGRRLGKDERLAAGELTPGVVLVVDEAQPDADPRGLRVPVLGDALHDALAQLAGGLLGGDATGQADPEAAAKTEAASKLGLEAILGGLAKNAESPRGAKSLERALRKHDGSVLDDLPSSLGSLSNTADGEKILGHVFGKNQQAVTQSLASKSGMDVGAIGKLLPMLAPVVMGMLAKKGRTGLAHQDSTRSEISQCP